MERELFVHSAHEKGRVSLYALFVSNGGDGMIECGMGDADCLMPCHPAAPRARHMLYTVLCAVQCSVYKQCSE